MFWNDPSLYGVSFKEPITPPVPFFGIEPPKVFPRFVPPYPQLGYTPQFPGLVNLLHQLGYIPQFPGLMNQLPQPGYTPQFPGVMNQLPQPGYTPQFPGLPNQPQQFGQFGMAPQFPQFPQFPQIPQFPQFPMTQGFFNPQMTPFTPHIPTANVPFFQPYNVPTPMFHPYRPFTF